MPRKIDLPALKARSIEAIQDARDRYETAMEADLDYLLVRWIAQMTAVEIHSMWERYVENRIVTALNHDAAHFVSENEIKGVTRVTSGLAVYIVRGGGRFFDFRSMSELIQKTDRWLGEPKNMFRDISANERAYIDALATIRNFIVHRSDAAGTAYRRVLKAVYGISKAPEPDEFLNAKDSRAASPERYKTRLQGLTSVVATAINDT